MSNYLTKSFTAVEVGGAISFKHKDTLKYSVSGTFSGTVVLQKSTDGGLTYQNILSKTSAATGSIEVENPGGGSALYRFSCTAYTSGTIVTLVYLIPSNVKKIMISGNRGGVSSGMATGWISPNLGYAKLPAGEADSELALAVSGLSLGTKIIGYYLHGRLESAGNTASITCIPSYNIASAAAMTDDTVPGASTLTISATADTLLSEANSFSALNHSIKDGESIYFYFLGTTGASTEIYLSGVTLLVVDA